MSRVVVNASVAIKWLVPFRQDDANFEKALVLIEQTASFEVTMIQQQYLMLKLCR